MKLILRITALACLLFLTACPDKDLQTIAQSLNEAQLAIGTLQTAVITANGQKLISDATTGTILQATVRINIAGQQAVQITRGISQLDPTNSTQLIGILTPVIAVLQQEQTFVVANITNPNTRDQIAASLAAIQATLNGVQLVLAAHQ